MAVPMKMTRRTTMKVTPNDLSKAFDKVMTTRKRHVVFAFLASKARRFRFGVWGSLFLAYTHTPWRSQRFCFNF